MTRQKIFKLTFVLLSLFFVISCEKDKYGVVTFEVKDDAGTAVSDVKIKIDNQEIVTNAEGTAKIEVLEGSYDYSIEKEGFANNSGNVTVTESGFTQKITLSKTLMAGVFELNVSDRKKWYYFSFEEGLVGEGSANPDDGDDDKWKEKDNWDLAFHNANVRTNSGMSGNGQGGALKMENENMNEVTEAPESGYVEDAIIRILLAMPPSNPNEDIKHVGGSPILDAWAEFSHETMSWTITKKVFVVKTADGKYAKIKFINYLNDEDQAGHLKFDYEYQANGTTKF